MKKVIIITIILFFPLFVVCAQTFTWSALGTGLNGYINAIAVDGSIVYYGGNYTFGSSKGIGYWNGSNWIEVGHGISNLRDYTNWEEVVSAIAISGSNVYIGGNFLDAVNTDDSYDEAKGIARWNGSTWVDLGSGISDGFVNPSSPYVYAIVIIGSDVYIGGEFQKVNGITVNSVAKWNGSTWSPLGKGITAGSQQVNTLATDGTDLYVGGNFTAVTNSDNSIVSANNIAKWNIATSTWSVLGGGADNGVSAIKTSGGDVYVGGGFTSVTNPDNSVITANEIAKWNGTVWQAIGSGATIGNVSAIEIFGGDVYVARNYWTGSEFQRLVSKWTGSAWVDCGGSANNNIFALGVQTSSGSMFVGGNFTTVNGGISANYAAKFSDPDNPLPVELNSFTANVSNCNVEFEWYTATEVNNYGFEIERRCIKNEKWQKIGFVEGNGTSNTPHKYSYFDQKLSAGRYEYRLKQVDIDGSFKYSQSVEIEIGLIPKEISLSNYPNPFNPMTTIQFTLAENGLTNLKVFNILGKEVAVLVSEHLQSGVLHKVNFDASKLTSGVYFCVLETNNVKQSRKLLLIK